MTSPYLFVHIPKTAGSSFRKSLESEFEGKVFCDYGPTSEETSALVMQHVYEVKDFYQLHKDLVNSNASFLAGHYPAHKYARLFSVSRTITFVRKPVERVISEYKHFVRIHGYKGSLLEFARSAEKINMHQRFLKNLPWQAIGFIGVMDRYKASVQLLNHFFAFNLPILQRNVAPQSQAENLKVTREDLQEISKLNQADIELYKKINDYLDTRIDCKKNKLPFIAGEFDLVRNGLRGWAFQHFSDQAVELEFFENKVKIGETLATQFNTVMRNLKSPRDGFVGFQFNPGESVDTAQITCRVKSTGQEIFNLSAR